MTYSLLDKKEGRIKAISHPNIPSCTLVEERAWLESYLHHRRAVVSILPFRVEGTVECQPSHTITPSSTVLKSVCVWGGGVELHPILHI